MTDIVKRLREAQSARVFDDALTGRDPLPLDEAADEIERLRAALAYWLHDEEVRDFGEWFESGCRIARAALKGSER